jgi:uncharacterized protein YeeX (DUF496 family)
MLIKLAFIIVGVLVSAVAIWVRGVNNKVNDNAQRIALLEQSNIIKSEVHKEKAESIQKSLVEMNTKLDSMISRFSIIEKSLAQNGIIVP